MNLDFILTVVSYSAIIMLLHFYITKPDVNNIKEVHINDNNKKSVVVKKHSSKKDDDMILSHEDLDKMTKQEYNSDFLKYLNVEEFESNQQISNVLDKENIDAYDKNVLQQYSSGNLNTNTDIDLGKYTSKEDSGLEEYYKSLKDETYEYKPTLSNSDDITTKISGKDTYDSVSAFDEFSSSNFSAQYAPIL